MAGVASKVGYRHPATMLNSTATFRSLVCHLLPTASVGAFRQMNASSVAALSMGIITPPNAVADSSSGSHNLRAPSLQPFVRHSTQTAFFSSVSAAPLDTASPATRSTTASIIVRHHLPVLLLPLPSRRDEAGCEFVFRPSTTTVERLLADIQKEDPGIERIFVTVDGTRVAKRTALQDLLAQGFDIHLNDVIYPVAPINVDHKPVEYEAMSQTETDEVKDLVKNLYAVLNMRPHLIEQSAELRRQIETNRLELAALEQQLETIKKNTERKLVQFNHFNLFLMSVQFGMFARLTWWEYSWDIMEPVTYFTTTFHAMVLVYGWSALTRKDLLYPVAADHFYLKWLYKLSGKDKFDIERYNALRERIYEDESALKRIRTPLESNFWISPPLPQPKE